MKIQTNKLLQNEQVKRQHFSQHAKISLSKKSLKLKLSQKSEKTQKTKIYLTVNVFVIGSIWDEFLANIAEAYTSTVTWLKFELKLTL